MSNVRLSNGSPTLERMDARLPDHAKPSACRNLFGTVDHEELTQDLNGHLQGMVEQTSAKYNFDFLNNKPQQGRFEWKIVNSKDVPEFYSKQQRAPKDIRRSVNNAVDLNGNHSCLRVTPCPGAGDRFTEEKPEKAESPADPKDQCSGQRKRPASHDSSSQNKRAHTSPDEVTRSPALLRSVERTPRKPSPKT
ncbi:hypothetical protein COCON_G00124170 [Conger conger]|uniref:Cyclin-dependent kinase inhibitor 1B n=1 Tax=Conger conger TaxID=82655 RepID=A0A9Q1DI70_CONCO|nr:cyclin-dependent kinase inhibitor 1B-like [Conger conger]KAJ8269810.1 hypothetical protein COCON_G00124170 [Conger conger]